MSESWEKQIAELQTDIKHMLNSQEIMQKQIRDLQRMSNMGAGGLKVLLIVGACLAAMYTWIRLLD
tara:strand:+ start:174 stop:371 length:198 start_codon:yes stop_codon:yes gene_type:complete